MKYRYERLKLLARHSAGFPLTRLGGLYTVFRVIFYEHEAKQLLRMAGLSVPGSILVSNRGSLRQQEPKLPAVLKAQTPFGKRSQQGGVRFVKSESQLELALSDLLGADFQGFQVEHVLIEEQIRYDQEWFVSLSYDSLLRSPILLLSPHGGEGIEDLGVTQPNAVWKMTLTAHQEILPHHLTGWLYKKGLRGNQLRDFSQLLRNLIRHFFEWDALLLEINPLVQDQEGKYVALDCHLEVDDDALQRHTFETLLGRVVSPKERRGRRQTAFESRAQEIDETDYRGVAGRLIEFPGNLGLLIGGGGASLTIFDAILSHNGKPANYCEIGGNPTAEKLASLTELIVAQPKVEKLAVIMNVVNNTQADLVAEGVIRGIRAAGKIPQDIIVMFRLPGSGEERCREILSAHNVPFTDRSVTIDEAALRAVEAVRAIHGTEVRK